MGNVTITLPRGEAEILKRMLDIVANLAAKGEKGEASEDHRAVRLKAQQLSFRVEKALEGR